MEVPPIWLLFGSQIHQDFMSEDLDPALAFAEMFDRFSAAEREELHAFLVQVTNAGHTPEELAQLWFESHAQFFVLLADVPELYSGILEWLRESIERSLSPRGE